MVSVSNIEKSYGRKRALEPVSFEAAPGDCICIAGKNGSGKTTLLRILAGVLYADDGIITYFGKTTFAGKSGRIKRDDTVFRKYCGYLPQGNPLIEDLSAVDNLKLWGNAGKEELEKTIDQFGLKEYGFKAVRTFSGGMKRRLSLAIAVLKDPPLLIMDEPTSALDTDFKKEVWELLSIHKKRGGIIIMSSHDREEMEMATKIIKL